MNTCLVAPYVGAWIETVIYQQQNEQHVSHPTWVRGLKQDVLQFLNEFKSSHPTWVRGLKHTVTRFVPECEVSHPTWVRGLKRFLYCALSVGRCRTLRGCVD